jgi:protein ImuB
MDWLAVYLPGLPLEALALPPADGGRVVLDAVGAQRIVCVADPTARAAGVRPGMPWSSARLLCPGLQSHTRAPVQEAALLKTLALTCSRFTPQLVVRQTGQAGLWLHVGPSLRLFGGLRALVADLRASLAACGMQARLGAAPTPLAAWLFARLPRPGAGAWQQRLGALPLVPALAVLDAAPRLAELLQGIGARTLADVRALPRAGLQRRGGGELLAQLDRAWGDAPDPQRWFVFPPRFALGLELLQRADDALALAFAAQRLVQALAGWLGAQWLAAAAFSLWLQHETTGRHAQAPTRLRVELGQPSRQAPQLMTLLRERLQRCALPAPVYGLRLVADEVQPDAGRAATLWSDATQQADDLRALLDRLSARLGAEQVCRLAPVADHRPEHAMQAWPAIGAPPPRALDVSVPDLPRPAWLLPAPLPLPTAADGRPQLGGRPLVLRSRAERIEAGWFDERGAASRDYHVAEASDHRLCWVYRERGGGADARWYLHGLFG